MHPAKRFFVYSDYSVPKKITYLLALSALIAALFGGCARIQEFILPTPSVPGEWNALLAEVRVFERRIGFHKETENFKTVFKEAGSYSMCGYAPRLRLPITSRASTCPAMVAHGNACATRWPQAAAKPP